MKNHICFNNRITSIELRIIGFHQFQNFVFTGTQKNILSAVGTIEMLCLRNTRRNKRFTENPLAQFLIFKPLNKTENSVKLHIVAHDNLDR